MRWTRRPALTDDLRRSLGLAPGDRVLSFAGVPDGGVAVATRLALHVRGAGVEPLTIPWHLVLSARWDDEAAALLVEEAGGAGRAGAVHRLTLVDPALLPETVRERVQASIVVSRHLRLVGTEGVRVVGRRIPDSDDLIWQVVWDAGVDTGVPEHQERAQALVAQLKEQTGT